MAKPELRDHRKFLKLCRLLNAPIPHVLGYLDCLWNRGYQTGNPFIGDEDDIEAAAMFPGDRGAFAKAAFESGFLDRDDNGNFIIHDLYDHAPKYAKMRIERAGFRPKPAQTCHSTAQKSQVVPKTVTNVPGRVTPNQTKPNQNHKSPPTPPSGGASNENAKNAITDTKTDADAREAESHQDNAANAKPDGKESISFAVHGGIYDAIAEITGRDRITAKGILLPVFRAVVEGGYTAADVHEFGRRFRELLPGKSAARPTPGEVRNNIGLIRAVKLGENNGAKTKFRQQLDTVAGFLLNGVEHQPENSVLSLSSGGGQ